jgi:hypothetical protein
MSTLNTTRWIGIGLLGLPLYGALFFWSSFEGQPDPDTQLRSWSRFVTTDYYVISHLLSNILGSIFLIFGVFALGAYLATTRAGSMGLVAMFLTVLGSTLYLPLQGVATFAWPKEGQAVLAGLEEFEALPPIFANTVQGLTALVVILLGFVGNILVGAAVWLSGTLPKWSGVLWAGAHVLTSLSLIYGQTISPYRTPFTVPLGAVVVVISGGWIALSVLSRPSGAPVGAAAQPRVR